MNFDKIKYSVVVYPKYGTSPDVGSYNSPEDIILNIYYIHFYNDIDELLKKIENLKKGESIFDKRKEHFIIITKIN